MGGSLSVEYCHIICAHVILHTTHYIQHFKDHIESLNTMSQGRKVCQAVQFLSLLLTITGTKVEIKLKLKLAVYVMHDEQVLIQKMRIGVTIHFRRQRLTGYQ